MKNNILKISIVAIIIILLIQLNTFATSITIETKTDGNTYSLGGTVTSTIEWTEGMQATGFTLKYNSTKLSFTEASIGEDFYNISEPTLDSTTGDYYTNIVVSWASFEEEDFTNITFKFTTLSTGEANIAITNVECFADGNLESPEEIDYTTKGTKTIQILALGDVNLDGEINNKDVTHLYQYLEKVIELSEEELVNADVNLDGGVSAKDRAIINRYIDETGSFEVELEEDALIRADVNVDGLVNSSDAEILAEYLVGDIDKLPVQAITNSNLNVSSVENMAIISGFEQEDMNVSDLIKNFNNDIGVNVYDADGEELTSNDSIGTGAVVKIGEDENGCIAEYSVVLYGDTTGDGKINAIDALALIKDINNKITFSNEIYREAGRIITVSPETPTAVDALAIIKNSNGKYEISQTK